MSKLIGVVDIETTGFINQGGLIVEIGIVSLDLDTGEVKEVFNSVVKEEGFSEKHLEKPYGWIFQNSDLTYDEVINAPYLENLLPQIQEICDSFELGLTAYNKAFDFTYLKDRGLNFKELNCIMLRATPIVNLPPNPGFSEPKWPNVEEAWAFFFPDRPYVEKHRASDDALHEAEIAYQIHLIGKTNTLKEKR